MTKVKKLTVLMLLFIVCFTMTIVCGCMNNDPVEDPDHTIDTDGDTDGSTDGDTDGSTDGDTDGSTDGDTDGDSDGGGSVVSEYTITFMNYDGTVLQSTMYASGETPVYSGETPVKASDVQYSYTFTGWDSEIVAVTGTATYTATFTAFVNKYVIKFVNCDDDSTVLQSEEVEYGEIPVYNGETPVKASDVQYSYTFTGWDSEIVAVTGTATYTATFTAFVNKYVIKFVNCDDDSTVLQSEEVEYGEIPVYNGETPDIEEDYVYYTFTGWDKEIVAVTGDATYTATYTTETFSISVETTKLNLAPEESGTITIEQSHNKSFEVVLISDDPTVAKIADGKVIGVAKGTTVVYLTCGNQNAEITVVVDNPPTLDGVIDEEQYGTTYMQYTFQYGEYTARGTADVFLYTYSGEEGVYMVLDVVGPSNLKESTALEGSGVMLMVKNAVSGDGIYLRAYTNGTIRICPLSSVITNNNGYTDATNYSGNAAGTCSWFKNTVVGDTDYCSQFTMEFYFEYSEYGVSKAEELSFVLGWISNDSWEAVYGADGTLSFANRVSTSDSTANYSATAIAENSWWTYKNIVAQKANTKTIRLDGVVDSAYTNSITYSGTYSSDASDTTTTKLYWYDDADGGALFLAFEVTCTTPKTIQNVTWGNTPGNAGVIFAVGKTGGTSVTWMRAFATNISYKTMTSATTNFYSCTNTFSDYVRGNQGAVAGASRTNVITSYVIEVRIDYNDYGVTSGSQLSILLGGIHDAGESTFDKFWHYNRTDGTIYELSNTGDSTAATQVTSTDSDYYWTLEQLEAEMTKQQGNEGSEG